MWHTLCPVHLCDPVTNQVLSFTHQSLAQINQSATGHHSLIHLIRLFPAAEVFRQAWTVKNLPEGPMPHRDDTRSIPALQLRQPATEALTGGLSVHFNVHLTSIFVELSPLDINGSIYRQQQAFLFSPVPSLFHSSSSPSLVLKWPHIKCKQMPVLALLIALRTCSSNLLRPRNETSCVVIQKELS